MRKAARSFVVLCLAACIVAALLGCAVLSARHGVHRFFCPDENCGVCFSIEAHRSAVESWGLLVLGLAMLVFAGLTMRALVCVTDENTHNYTLYTLGVRLNS